jgi:hypothetical protein
MTSATIQSTAVEYRHSEHGFFPELVRLVICLSAVGIAFELHKAGTVKPYGPSQPMVLEGKQSVSGLEVHFFPRPLYDKLLSPSGRQPRFLEVVKKQISTAPPDHPIKLSTVQLMMSRLVGDAFVSYYERHLAPAEKKWGSAKSGWTDLWRYGWAMRNALSHDGKISFPSPSSKPVHWKSLQYSYADNGRQVLFNELTGVELILLMEEMDLALNQ